MTDPLELEDAQRRILETVVPLAVERCPLDQAFEECDVVATSGGISVGDSDFVRGALAVLAADLVNSELTFGEVESCRFGRGAGRIG